MPSCSESFHLTWNPSFIRQLRVMDGVDIPKEEKRIMGREEIT